MDTNQTSEISENDSEMSANVSKRQLALADSDIAWPQLVERIANELHEADLPEEVIQATELLLAGHPVYKVAQKLGKTTQTIRRWISRYPTVAAVLADTKRYLTMWRMARLEQQFLSAIERSQEILDIDLSGYTQNEKKVDSKVLTVIAAQARYIIGLFAGQRIDVKVEHELGETVLQATKGALSYIADRLAEQQLNAENEPVEAVYRVIDAKFKDSGPLLDEDGKPPFGQLGVLGKSDDRLLCHICGKWYKGLIKHLRMAHDITVEDYETLYMLKEGSLRKTEKSNEQAK